MRANIFKKILIMVIFNRHILKYTLWKCITPYIPLDSLLWLLTLQILNSTHSCTLYLIWFRSFTFYVYNKSVYLVLVNQIYCMFFILITKSLDYDVFIFYLHVFPIQFPIMMYTFLLCFINPFMYNLILLYACIYISFHIVFYAWGPWHVKGQSLWLNRQDIQINK